MKYAPTWITFTKFNKIKKTKSAWWVWLSKNRRMDWMWWVKIQTWKAGISIYFHYNTTYIPFFTVKKNINIFKIKSFFPLCIVWLNQVFPRVLMQCLFMDGNKIPTTSSGRCYSSSFRNRMLSNHTQSWFMSPALSMCKMWGEKKGHTRDLTQVRTADKIKKPD